MPLFANLPTGRSRRRATHSSTVELAESLRQARDMPDDMDKIGELERIAAHADAAGDVRLGFDSRAELIEVCDVRAERWRMLPAFDWCLATYDRDRPTFTRRDAEHLRRWHAWTVAELCATPRVGLARTRSALDGLERRLREDGYGLRRVYRLRCELADHLGDEPAARAWLARWREAEADRPGDCADCELSRQAELLAGWGEWAQAVQILESLVDDPPGQVDQPEQAHGQVDQPEQAYGHVERPERAPFCVEQPERALVTMLLPLLRLGRVAAAAQAHVRAYRRQRDERDALRFLPDHLLFCALTGHYGRGMDILAAHLARLDRPYDDASAMRFATAGALLCRLAIASGLDRTVHRAGLGDRPAAQVPVGDLSADLLRVAQDLAGRFDARNGTSHQSGRVAACLDLRPLCEPPDLPVEELTEEPAGPAEEPAGPAEERAEPLNELAEAGAPAEPADEPAGALVERPGGR